MSLNTALILCFQISFVSNTTVYTVVETHYT